MVCSRIMAMNIMNDPEYGMDGVFYQIVLEYRSEFLNKMGLLKQFSNEMIIPEWIKIDWEF